jgi:two-component system sensor histidine kinase BaeS
VTHPYSLAPKFGHLMRSITFKLTIAFLLVGLTGAMLVAAISWQRTRTAFSQFILNQEQQTLVDNLLQYYQTNGSWDGLDRNLQSFGIAPFSSDNRRDSRRGWGRFTLVGSDRTVVYSNLAGQTGQRVSNSELENAFPLEVNSQGIGWLLLDPAPRDSIPDSPEQNFLSNVNSATLLSALIATALALTIGGLLAFTMTRSLRELTEATVEIAKGKLGKQVKVRSKDELGELAQSFNRMSLDLERATQARRQMTADIAHDLRSPLSVITGYAEALSDGKLEGTPEVYAILHQETRLLSRLIDDLRTLSLADAGELPLTPQPIQPRVLLEQVAARHAVAAQQKEIVLRVDAGDNLPMVQVDIERMAQVLDNLILNAFRFTPAQGEVTLTAHTSEGSVQIQVRDTGSGIAAADLEHIFDRFYRGDTARPQNGESGLGLAIARSIVEAHGGSIRADSVPGQGATFTISLQAR